MLSLPTYTTISVAGTPSLLSNDFHDPHLVSFGGLEGEENSKGQTKNADSDRANCSIRMAHSKDLDGEYISLHQIAPFA